MTVPFARVDTRSRLERVVSEALELYQKETREVKMQVSLESRHSFLIIHPDPRMLQGTNMIVDALLSR